MMSNDKTQSDAAAETFRVLSLDGGGAKGVYTLGVLKEVEAMANAPLCEVFDLVFGTSTGSIIAALIALGYRVEEIENFYFEIIPKIMKRRFSGSRSKALKREVEKLFEEQNFSAFKIPIGIVCTLASGHNQVPLPEDAEWQASHQDLMGRSASDGESLRE